MVDPVGKVLKKGKAWKANKLLKANAAKKKAKVWNEKTLRKVETKADPKKYVDKVL